jgi:hypothetical protein
MQVASFTQVGSFTLRTNDGQLIEMSAEGNIGITAGHLREHMTLAEPVAVTVRYDGNRVIATYVDDAASPTPASAPAKP